MFNAERLNSKARKGVAAQLEAQFGFSGGLGVLFRNEKGKLYLADDALEDFELEGLRVDALGLYLGQVMKDGAVRLSVEGSQLVGPASSKGVVELSDDEFRDWIRGRDLEKGTDEDGFVILKHGADYVGCGKVVVEKGLIHNYVPKTRYVRSED